MTESVDVLIVGAGNLRHCGGLLSGRRCPQRTFAIVEGREAIGGTWDFVSLPGRALRLGYVHVWLSFPPLDRRASHRRRPGDIAVSQGHGARFGIDKQIRFNQRVRRVSWLSKTAEWTVDIERVGEGAVQQMRCKFLFMCTGYYRYDEGYTPRWEGRERFAGEIIHPQQWHAGIDYAGKRIVVIGSGATAGSLAPALAEQRARDQAAAFAQLRCQFPAQDGYRCGCTGVWPLKLAAWLARWRLVLRQMYYYYSARTMPQETRRLIRQAVEQELGPDYDIERHFAPRYNPWDQRLCLARDSDLFNAIIAGAVSVVTERIDRFVEAGIRLESGQVLPADIIVTATGLQMKLMHGVEIVVDGAPVALAIRAATWADVQRHSQSGISFRLYQRVLDAESRAYLRVCLSAFEPHAAARHAQCRPRFDAAEPETEAFVDFSSGYVQRALESLPKQGRRRPWKVYQNYLKRPAGHALRAAARRRDGV